MPANPQRLFTLRRADVLRRIDARIESARRGVASLEFALYVGHRVGAAAGMDALYRIHTVAKERLASMERRRARVEGFSNG